ncbi:alpha/beta fold hydrolase [Granulicoccus phenolivorans]|uniref:alpha/beta fold hydrolase n=1 Tax=Granulicoccus phenolivorans TaxID=266854 RepID=UPI000405B8F9|nr:alpha/beta hydrolase [Granulicoccus phenolivorans]
MSDPRPEQPTSKRFTASDGVEIEYYDLGTGPALLNPHPYGGSATNQLPLLAGLSDRFRCVTFSQRGWGETPLAGAISLDRSAQDAHELLEFLGIDDAYFVGLSMGASVMFAYVARYGTQFMNRAFIMDMTPSLVNRDDFVGGLYQGWYSPERYAADLALQETDLPTFLRYFYEQALFPHTRDQVRTFVADPQFDGPLEAAAALTGVTAAEMYAGAPNDPATLRAYWRAMGEADFRADLARFDVPTFLYYAQPGSIYDQRTAEFVRDQIPGSELAYSPDSTHMSFLAQNLAEQVALIREFADPA